MAGQFGRCQRWLLAAWVVPFIGFFVFAFIVPERKLEAQAKERKELRVYSNPEYYRKLEKPAEFGLEKLASVVNYLLLATAAILGFMTKALMDFRSERAKGDARPTGQLRRVHYLLFLHAAIACLFSLSWGVLAYLTLPDISVLERFPVTGVLSRRSWC
jgi:hypothetical protein